MSRRNRVRYQSKGNPYPPLIMTGKVFLRDEDNAAAGKGDLRIYLSTDALPGNTHPGDFSAAGLEGYLKAEVFDGKGWKPLSLEEFFPGREYYFGKRERPADTYNVCVGALRTAAGTQLIRTYREHYVKAD